MSEVPSEKQLSNLDSDIERSVNEPAAVAPAAPDFDFPEGGLRAWSVAAGAAGVLFCTFGYANAFG
jgi:hypothetical protein